MREKTKPKQHELVWHCQCLEVEGEIYYVGKFGGDEAMELLCILILVDSWWHLSKPADPYSKSCSFYCIAKIVAMYYEFVVSIDGFGIYSTPTGIPNLRCGEEENFIQCKTALLWYSTAVKTAQLQAALGPGGSRARKPWGQAPLCIDSSVLFLAVLLWSAPVLAGLLWSGKQAFTATGELAYIKRNPHPWPLIGLSSCKWGLQTLTVWLVQKALFWLAIVKMLWLVGEEADED